jgi:hypothetical protein
MKRYLAFLWALLAFVSVSYALPPGNDDFDSATLAVNIPFTDDSVNTEEATSAADDPSCLGNDHSVWYAFTPQINIRLEANTFGSDYDTTVSAWTGSRGNLEFVACDDDSANSLQSRIRFDAQAGTTYYFMVGSFPTSPGGNLVFNLLEAPPPPPVLTLDVELSSVGRVDPKTGVATVHGTVLCSRPVFVQLFGALKQKLGRVFISGSFSDGISCEGQNNWSADVVGENGLFTGGRAEAFVQAFAFDEEEDDSAFDEDSGIIRLTGSPK